MRQVILLVLRVYKLGVSPLLPPACRFHPTCSEYCAEAVARHGAWRGLWLGAQRLLRCQPLTPGGFDPVPEREPASEPEQ